MRSLLIQFLALSFILGLSRSVAQAACIDLQATTSGAIREVTSDNCIGSAGRYVDYNPKTTDGGEIEQAAANYRKANNIQDPGITASNVSGSAIDPNLLGPNSGRTYAKQPKVVADPSEGGKYIQLSDTERANYPNCDKTINPAQAVTTEGDSINYNGDQQQCWVRADKYNAWKTSKTNIDNDAQAKELAEKCGVDTDTAVQICSPEQNAGIGAFTQVVDGFAQMGGMYAASNPATACGSMGQLLMGANGALLAYKGVCTVKYTECNGSCKDAMTDFSEKEAMYRKQAAAGGPNAATAQYNAKLYHEKLTAAQASNRQCQAQQAKIAAAVGNIMAIAMQVMASQQCKNQSYNNIQDYCKDSSHYNEQVCMNLASSNCANPTAQTTNLVCICQMNPADSRCGGSGIDASAFSRGATTGLAGTNPGANGSAAAFGSVGVGDSGINSVAAGNPAKPVDGSLARGGQGGGKGGLSGDTGSPQNRGAGKGNSDWNTKINSGTYGGTGGYGGGSYSGGYGGRGYGDPNAGAGAMKENFDLKKYLPNGKYDTRGLAGMTGPDGMTGPNTNIWEKIKIRYYSVSPSLNP